MLAEFFWRAGYQVVGGPACTGAAIVSTLRAQAIDVLGLSASCDQSLRALPQLIASVRRISSNRSIRVLIGGVATLSCPDALKITGADALATDPLQALSIVEAWIKNGSVRKVNTLRGLRPDVMRIRHTAEQQSVG
jgi:methylmalonyl-CoA mutase cobalamin-binding subunit